MALALAIETSCDDTGAAVVDSDWHVHSSVIESSIDQHRAFGGVVPELAGRAHLTTIGPVVERALREAGLDPLAPAIDVVAVTSGPGLIGSLLIGLSAAKAYALAWNKPFVGVNGFQVTAYLGNVIAQVGVYNSTDVSQIQGFIVGAVKAFALYPNVDPRLLADVNEDGIVNAIDVSRWQNSPCPNYYDFRVGSTCHGGQECPWQSIHCESLSYFTPKNLLFLAWPYQFFHLTDEALNIVRAVPTKPCTVRPGLEELLAQAAVQNPAK